MALAVDSFVGHAVIVRMNKQFFEVTAGKVMFSRNNCMESTYDVCAAYNGVADSMMCSALLLMNKENLCLCLYGVILPP